MKPHSTDGISLTFGLIFVGAAMLWLIVRLVSLDAIMVGWIVVSSLFLLGVLGVAHAVTRSTGRRDTEDQPHP